MNKEELENIRSAAVIDLNDNKHESMLSSYIIAQPFIDDLCNSIDAFISKESSSIAHLQTEREKLQLIVSIVNTISAYVSNYSKNHMRLMHRTEGLVEENKNAIKSINSVIDKKIMKIETDIRLAEKIKAGEDPLKRKKSQRPEKIKDVKSAKASMKKS